MKSCAVIQEKYPEEPAISRSSEPEPAVPGLVYDRPRDRVSRSQYDEIPDITKNPEQFLKKKLLHQ
jgi:hypothetical protein